MRAIYLDSKMPTVSECETLGAELGLPRRVVQVWFQNSRAKEKKGMDFGRKSHSLGGALSPGEQGCALCGDAYSSQNSQQDHLYTRRHLERVKAMVARHELRLSSPGVVDGGDGTGKGLASEKSGEGITR